MSTQPYFEAVARQMPQARYVLPDFEERTAYGFRRQNPYTKLFEDRIVFLGVQVDDASADDVMAQLLVLESQDPDSLITMYINSPGGSFFNPLQGLSVTFCNQNHTPKLKKTLYTDPWFEQFFQNHIL